MPRPAAALIENAPVLLSMVTIPVLENATASEVAAVISPVTSLMMSSETG